ncbi:MAG: hypothetical protein AB1451_13315 [Nitrospirota bacterium]
MRDTIEVPVSVTTFASGPSDRPSRGFDWWLTSCSSWMVVGLYLDGWAHRHLHDLDTFFTPWHGVLYSGFVACAGLLTWRRLRSGTLPPGYGPSFLGVGIFTLGGVGDLIWHTLLGVEVDLDALLSPTHLALAAGGALIISGPFRAEWLRQRRGALTFSQAVPMLVSLTLVWSVFTFFTQFAHPLVHLWSAGPPPSGPFMPQALGIASILLQAALMAGAVLLAVRRWDLPFGSLSLVIVLNAALVGGLENHLGFVWLGLVSGLIADALLWTLKPSISRPTAFRVFACLVPATFYALYFAALARAAGVWWAVPMWTGSIVLAGAVGWMLSLLILPSTGSHQA